MMQHITNLCVEIESRSSSDGEMEVEDASKMQVSPPETTVPVVPKDAAAVGIYVQSS
jgi:hypothetical protein